MEYGDYCVRSNENSVDLNRNWGDHWLNETSSAEAIRKQAFGGNHAFSEEETLILKRVASEFKVDSKWERRQKKKTKWRAEMNFAFSLASADRLLDR